MKILICTFSLKDFFKCAKNSLFAAECYFRKKSANLEQTRFYNRTKSNTDSKIRILSKNILKLIYS